MILVFTSGQMENNIEDSGNKTKRMDLENIPTRIVVIMLGHIAMTNLMELELMCGLMEIITKVNGRMVKEQETDILSGQRKMLTLKDSLRKTILKEKAHFIMKMVLTIKENFQRTREKDWVRWFGQTILGTWVIGWMERKMEMGRQKQLEVKL